MRPIIRVIRVIQLVENTGRPDRIGDGVLLDTWFRKYLGAYIATLFPTPTPRAASRALPAGVCSRESGERKGNISRSLATKIPGCYPSFSRGSLDCSCLVSSRLGSPPPWRTAGGTGGKPRRRPHGYQTRAWRTMEDDAQLRQTRTKWGRSKKSLGAFGKRRRGDILHDRQTSTGSRNFSVKIFRDQRIFHKCL